MTERTLTREQVREVDRRAVKEYEMSSLVLMENAGRGCADALERLGVSGTVVVCCGKGNNAGDGFVLARHLDLRGHGVNVLLWSDPGELSGDAQANYRILAKSGVPIRVMPASGGEAAKNEEAASAAAGDELKRELEGAEWIVDALLGTGARGAPRPPLDAVIPLLNAAAAKRMAVDLPSGLDCDNGEPAAITFRADHTCTFVAAKRGFTAPEARPWLGEVHVLDIGAPRKLIEEAFSES